MITRFKIAAVFAFIAGVAMAAQPVAADSFRLNVQGYFHGGHGGHHGGTTIYPPVYVPPVPHVPHRPHRPHHDRFGEAFCVAVGFRRHGHGPRIRGSRSVETVRVRLNAPEFRKQRRIRRACRRALAECERKISYLAGPFAVCTVRRSGIRR